MLSTAVTLLFFSTFVVVRLSINQCINRYISKKNIVVSLQAKITISIYYFVNNFFKNKNYFFESNEFDFTLYVYFINIFIKIILVRNNNKQIVKISRNFCFDHLIEINYFNIFFVSENVENLIIKTF